MRYYVTRAASFLRTPRGMWVIWILGTLGVLAAVSISGDVALLVIIADRELLVLVTETAVAYGVYAWRSGVAMVTWKWTLVALFPTMARSHVLLTRLSL